MHFLIKNGKIMGHKFHIPNLINAFFWFVYTHEIFALLSNFYDFDIDSYIYTKALKSINQAYAPTKITNMRWKETFLLHFRYSKQDIHNRVASFRTLLLRQPYHPATTTTTTNAAATIKENHHINGLHERYRFTFEYIYLGTI